MSYLDGQPARASELLPRVHGVVSLLKRWLLGTHQGAVSHEHLDYYLDEFTLRFKNGLLSPYKLATGLPSQAPFTQEQLNPGFGAVTTSSTRFPRS